MKLIIAVVTGLLLAGCASQSGGKNMEAKGSQLPELIPRQVLFGNPEKVSIKLSPDGKRLSYIAPDEKNVLNVWIKTVGKNDDKMVTHDTYRGIRSYGWAFNNEQIVYIQDKDGDENWHLYTVYLATGETKDLTPFDGVKASNIISNKNFPDMIYIGLNKRTKELFDLYLLNLKTGELVLDTQNPGDAEGFFADHTFTIRGLVASNPEDASSIIRIRATKDDPWENLLVFPFGENGSPIEFTPDNLNLYVTTSMGSDTTRLVEVDGTTGRELKTIFQSPRADVGSVFINPDSYQILAVATNYLREEWTVFDKETEADFAVLDKVRDGDFYVVSYDMSFNKWIVAYELDTAPYSYYLYDRTTKKAEFLFTHQPKLEKYTLAPMKPLLITARDGLSLPAYLTLPVGISHKNLPLVLYVHGGPWARDSWGYDATAQWLANRGYAVLQVNFRGSDGFGKNFINAGNGEWGVGAMQHDLTDAVNWAVKEGIADPKRVAIYGGSYGGYATLAGLTFTPDIYTCGVDVVGPSNIRTLMQTIPPYWKPFKLQMTKRIGDVEADDELNRKISPLFHVESIKVPLLIGQGANDPRVKITESDQIVEAMRKKKIPVTYIVFPDEGHGFARPENRLDFNGQVEQFFADHLKGRAELYQKVPGSTAETRQPAR